MTDDVDDPTALYMWTVYDHPRDFPNSFVARRFKTIGGSAPQATSSIIVSSTLPPIREFMQRRGLVRLERFDHDDPVILEVWL